MLVSVACQIGAVILGACSLFLAGIWGYGVSDAPRDPGTTVALVSAIVLFCTAMMLAGVA